MNTLPLLRIYLRQIMLLTSLLVVTPIQAENWVMVASFEDEGDARTLLVDTDSIRTVDGRLNFILAEYADIGVLISEEERALDCANRMFYYLSYRFDESVEFQQRPEWQRQEASPAGEAGASTLDAIIADYICAYKN